MSRLYCGACGWNYRHWRGVFYPDGLGQSNWLPYYATVFDTVEINASFYRLPERETFERWHSQTRDGFTFAVKASRYLTHIKKLADPAEPLDRLLTHSSGLGEKRGPMLFQFPPNWKIDLARLEALLKLLPTDLRSAFEFRGESWQCVALWSMLEHYRVSYCMMDSPGLPLHLRTTADYSYVRMHSGGEETEGDYSDQHLSVWARRVEDLLKLGDVYVYFNNDAHGFAVRNALALRKMVTGE